MTYLEKYFEIVNNPCDDKSDYCEMHHIVPRCFCGLLTKSRGNLVRLTAYNHFYAHYYLWKYCREEKKDKSWESKMWCALTKMHKNISKNVSEHEVVKIALAFQEIRENCCLNGKNNPMYGKNWKDYASEETIKSHNESLRGKRNSIKTEFKAKNRYPYNGCSYPSKELYDLMDEDIKIKCNYRMFRHYIEQINKENIKDCDVISTIEFIRTEYQRGNHVTEQTREKMRQKHRDTCFITNGIINKVIKKGSKIEEGFRLGKKTKPYHVYNDGKKDIQIIDGEPIPPNLKRGSVKRKDLSWIDFGVTTIKGWLLLNEENYIRKDGKYRPGIRCKCLNCGFEKVFPVSEVTRKNKGIGHHRCKRV